MFLALIVGEGGEASGCDYTIGCNKHWIWLDCRSMEEASKQVQEELENIYEGHKAELVTILQVFNKVDWDMDEYRRVRKVKLEEAQTDHTQKLERMLYEELKKKYEGK